MDKAEFYKLKDYSFGSENFEAWGDHPPYIEHWVENKSANHVMVFRIYVDHVETLEMSKIDFRDYQFKKLSRYEQEHIQE